MIRKIFSVCLVSLLAVGSLFAARESGPTLHVVFAQISGGHTAALSWTVSPDDTASNCAAPSVCSQNIYRAPGACPAVFSSTPFASVGGLATTFTDNSPLFGNSCYAVTFVVNSSESALSAGAGGSLRPSSPTGLTDVEK